MADIEYLVGTDAGDTLDGGSGENDYDGGAGNDSINGADGVNTIHFKRGDGADHVSFAMPRSYQYAQFITEATTALAQLATLDPNAEYTNSYFGSANFGLVQALPDSINSVLGAMRRSGGVLGAVDVASAQAAFNDLLDWASQANSNVVQMGPGIGVNDLQVQIGRTGTYGGQVVPLDFAVVLNNEEGMLFGLKGSEAVAGSTATPPAIDMVFRFDDGTSITLADLLARPGQGVIGTQNGTDDNDTMTGSLNGDYLFGNGGDDRIDAGAGFDQAFGGSGNDVISGGSGVDTIYGEDGDDVMAAGKGDPLSPPQIVSGGLGNDVYAYNRGDGKQFISNEDGDDGSGVDTISFGKSVSPADVTVSVDPSSGIVTLALAGTEDTISIAWFDTNNAMAPVASQVVERVQFFDADGNAHVYDLASLVQAAYPDPATADPAASVALVGPDAAEMSEPAAGGEAARLYAMSGKLFADSNLAPTSTTVTGPTALEDDASFSWTLPAGAFVDPEGAALALNATTATGEALPGWLHFDPATGTFSGTATNGDVGTISVKVTATDPGGLFTSQVFDLNVQNTNDAPMATGGTAAAAATEDAPFSYALPGGTFSDVDAGDSLTYSATRADGSALPSWLQVDAATGTLSGTPLNGDVGDLSVIVTATDSAGAPASKAITISVTNTNDAPTVANAIADQTTAEDSAFTFVLPANTFADVDLGDSMTLNATMADGTALPSWLSFNAATKTFSGTPANGDVGMLNVKVTAKDAAGASVSDTFAIGVTNTNDAPTYDHAVSAPAASEDAAFSFTLPANTFSDVDAGDSLTLSATRADGTALPSWLTFNPTTRTFSGTPANGDVGAISVKVTATDLAGAKASDVFAINVANTNDAPTVANAIADKTASEDSAFTFALPANTFADVDLGDSMTLSATRADGTALPSWLSFNALTRTFSGTPANGDVGTLSIKVTAKDSGNATVSDVFNVTIANTNDAPTVSSAVADQSGVAGSAYSMVVPTNVFQDVDAGDVLTLSAKLANGNPLPSWLTFNPATRTLSGTPGAAGQWDIQLTATDMSGASVSDVFSLNVSAAQQHVGKTINGTAKDETLTGTDYDDKITGGKGKDLLLGGAGNDTLYFSEDAKWGSGSTRTNAVTGEKASIAGKRRSYDVFDGATGTDTLVGTSGSDAILMDDSSSPALRSGARVQWVQKIDAGAGDDMVDLSSKRYSIGDIDIDGGSGNDTLWSSSGNDVVRGGSGNDSMDGGAGNDYLEGGSGNDTMNGGAGNDLLQGGSGNDKLTDTSGKALFDGGSGDDALVDGTGNSMLAGGKGNDKLTLGGGYDVIAFNRGDGRDVVTAGKGGQATLSLGGGISYKDLTLSRSGNDLILNIGSNDRITFEKWYEGRKYQAVSKLQVVAEAMPGFNEMGSNPLLDDKIETFDFKGLVKAFDTARSHNPGLSKWTMNNAMAQFHLGGSDTEALGGDLAYQYGMNGTLAGIAANAAQDTVGASQFGKQAQTLHSQTELKDGLVKLS